MSERGCRTANSENAPSGCRHLPARLQPSRFLPGRPCSRSPFPYLSRERVGVPNEGPPGPPLPSFMCGHQPALEASGERPGTDLGRQNGIGRLERSLNPISNYIAAVLIAASSSWNWNDHSLTKSAAVGSVPAACPRPHPLTLRI